MVRFRRFSITHSYRLHVIFDLLTEFKPLIAFVYANKLSCLILSHFLKSIMLLISLLFLSFAGTTLASEYNAATDQDKVVCVYPLSGQYGLLPRLLYYDLLIFAVLAQHQVWLIAGAPASALTYSGTAAIHAIILARVSMNLVFDIDVVGVWAIVSAGCVAVQPVLDWSSTLRESPYRPIFGFWGTLMTIGTICGVVALQRDYPEEMACRSRFKEFLTEPAQVVDPRFDCTYACFSTHQSLRAPSEIMVIPKIRVFGHYYTVTLVLVWIVILTGALLGVVACLPGERKRTNKQLNAAIRRNAPRDGDLPKVRGAKASARERAQEEKRTGVFQKRITMCAYVNPFILVATVILNELYLLAKGGLPTNEQAYAVGQWGPMVGRRSCSCCRRHQQTQRKQKG